MVLRASATGRVRAAAVAALPVLLVVQSLALAVPLLPNEDRSTLYPETPAQEFVNEHLGPGRMAAAGHIFYGNTPMLWRTRTFAGHTFHAPTWKDAILAVDANAFAGNPTETLPILAATTQVATSPILDRLGVTWFATPPDAPPFGTVEQHTLPSASCDGRTSVGSEVASVPAQDSTPTPTTHVAAGETGLRGVTVRICSGGEAVPYGARLVATAHAGDHEVTGATHLRAWLAPGDVTVGLPAEALGGADDIEISVELQGAPGVALTPATTAGGDLAVDLVRPTDDGLRLAYANDLRIYERTAALPRVRWAAHSEVVSQPGDRLERLRSGHVPVDTVVLSTEDANGLERSGRGDDSGDETADEAVVTIVEDGTDTIRLRVDAPALGYVVVADAMQTDWSAQIDGEAADLVDADHAGVAVAVPRGTHEVRLELTPRGRTTGLTLGLASVAGLAGAGAASLWRARRGSVAVGWSGLRPRIRPPAAGWGAGRRARRTRR
jgi:hypothetical protein